MIQFKILNQKLEIDPLYFFFFFTVTLGSFIELYVLCVILVTLLLMIVRDNVLKPKQDLPLQELNEKLETIQSEVSAIKINQGMTR